ncbi:MAG: alpha/beta hydrolase domain-containing protein [Gammaproteobacteria bacterium]|nr:alpha/beta hydrolase domain-containing protein [Gammaproteobacteria bacterium]
MNRITVLIALVFAGLFTANALAVVPAAEIIGPIEADPPGHSSRNSIYAASAIELNANGYVEEEFFIEGTANQYSNPELATGEVIDSGHRYRSRLIVRRPQAEDFNGIVIVEWINVTGGPDKDIDWWLSGTHFIRNGYAYVAVSAQQMGIDTMKEWSPQRYGTLDTTHDGMVARDGLSYDIFSAVGRAINRLGESTPPGQVDILDGLKAELIIATGHSQSASRLAVYLNNIHPLEPIYDGVMVHGGGGRIRDDQETKIFKIMAETDMARRAADPQPDTDTFIQWEVAGTSHADYDFEIEYSKLRLLRDGLPIAQAEARDVGCELPAHSRIPFRDPFNAAFEHLVRWIKEDVRPPGAEPLRVARMMPEVEFARDEYGNILGGIRLAEHAVATAKNTGMNSGVTNRFCFLYGSHEPFDKETLDSLYPSHEAYVNAVKAVVQQNLEAGYILPYAAERTIREAEASTIGSR